MQFRTRWVAAVLSAAALLACYAPILKGMAGQWWNDEDMGHGFLVPIVVFWIVWRERERWLGLRTGSGWWGFAVLAAAACMHLIATLGAGLFAGSVAFLLSVVGIAICFGGVPLLRVWLFPLLLAVFMLPKLAIVYNQATLPLQLLATRMAAGMLSVAGLRVIREGNILDVAGHRISVAEACSGIRYLLPLAFTALVFGYISDSKPRMRIALLIASAPVAILANAVRVAVTGWFPALDGGTLHTLCGWFIFVLCVATLVLVRRVFGIAFHSLSARYV